MPEPHIFTPREAQEELDYVRQLTGPAGDMESWAYTVATEPDRTRAARRAAWAEGWRDGWIAAGGSLDELNAHANDLPAKRAIENGADYA